MAEPNEEQPRDLTDEEKLRLLDPLMGLNRQFLRAWQSGMLVARSETDERWLEMIADGISLPMGPPKDEDLVELTEAEKLRVAEKAIVRLNLFKGAYLRGMIVAHDQEQQEILDSFARLWAPRRPTPTSASLLELPTPASSPDRTWHSGTTLSHNVNRPDSRRELPRGGSRSSRSGLFEARGLDDLLVVTEYRDFAARGRTSLSCRGWSRGLVGPGHARSIRDRQPAGGHHRRADALREGPATVGDDRRDHRLPTPTIGITP